MEGRLYTIERHGTEWVITVRGLGVLTVGSKSIARAVVRSALRNQGALRRLRPPRHEKRASGRRRRVTDE
jgi:hypothetical protein